MIYICQSQWNESITQPMAKEAERILLEAGKELKWIQVPGALEIPLALQLAYQARPKDFEGAIACGCVIKGETYHFDIVANESARGIQDLSLKISRPIMNAILAVYKIEEAIARSTGEHNKGREAALSLLQFLELSRKQEWSL